VVHQSLVAFLQVAVGDEPADVPLRGAHVALGVISDRLRGRVRAAAVFVGVVGVAKQDQLTDTVAAAHRQAQHE
jgi:hypothetical protein